MFGDPVTTTPPSPCCRFCAAPLTRTFVDLGSSPLCQTVLRPQDLELPETYYPLHVRICEECLLVQLAEYARRDVIFSADYPYFSSYSSSWLDHARRYVDMISDRLSLDDGSQVIEIASNDGYLSQHFVTRGIPVLGIEPASNVAAAARTKGIPVIEEFFGTSLASRLVSEGRRADLIIANNVLAHVPDLNDFVRGIELLLDRNGVITIEVPDLVNLIEGNEFDTIYHEHFSYFTFLTMMKILAAHGLEVFEVEELPTHGGAIRVYAQRQGERREPVSASVRDLANRQRSAGYDRLEAYIGFAERVAETRSGLLEFLIHARREGKSVVGYGAPGKGVTLLVYCGIRPDLLAYTVDRNPAKQDAYLPGCRIPILDPGAIADTKPDYVLILPWNLRDEIMREHHYISEWGGRFVTPIPKLEIHGPPVPTVETA